MSNGQTRIYGDYGGAGTQSHLNAVNKQLGDQLTSFTDKWVGQKGYERREETADIALEGTAKKKQKEKVVDDLKGEGSGGQTLGNVSNLIPSAGQYGTSDTSAGLGGLANYAMLAGSGFNPFMAAGVMALSIFSSRSQRKAKDAERAEIEARERTQRKMQARLEFAQGMRQIYTTSAGRRLNL